jgi:hypothetical protein
MRKLAIIFENMSVDCRHGVYVWWLTIACLSGMMLLAMTRSGDVAQHAVGVLGDVLMIIVPTYLGVEVVGRSQLLNKIGDRISSTVPATDPTQSAPAAQQ